MANTGLDVESHLLEGSKTRCAGMLFNKLLCPATRTAEKMGNLSIGEDQKNGRDLGVSASLILHITPNCSVCRDFWRHKKEFKYLKAAYISACRSAHLSMLLLV